MEPLLIDGSFGEGGGSILRLSSGFSVLKKIPIKIIKIRANRKKPGLRLQHLRGLQILEQLTEGNLSKCEVGTTEIEFSPGNTYKKNVTINVETAGNIALLLQPVQIACLGLEADRSINIEIRGGGTFGKWAPGTSFLKNVLFKIYEYSGYSIKINIIRHGFYPKGGAQVDCVISGPNQPVKPIIILELGKISKINGEIICTDTLRQPQVAERIKDTVISQIKNKLNLNCDINIEYVKAFSTGVGLCLWAESDVNAIVSSGTVLGEKGISSEQVGKIAVNNIVKKVRNHIPVDNYLADQLIPLMCYTDGKSEIKVAEITSHLKTNLDLIHKFKFGTYEIKKVSDGFIVSLRR